MKNAYKIIKENSINDNEREIAESIVKALPLIENNS